jgi:hypothetical protein
MPYIGNAAPGFAIGTMKPPEDNGRMSDETAVPPKDEVNAERKEPLIAFAAVPEVPQSVRAQLLATEHWSLLAS